MVLFFEDDGEVVAGFGGVAVAPGGADPGLGFGDFVVAVEDPSVGIPGGDDELGAEEGVGAGFAVVGGLVEEIEGAAGGGLGEGKVEGVVGELVGGVVELEGVGAGGDDGAEEGFAFGGLLLVEKDLAELHLDGGAGGDGGEAGAQDFFGGGVVVALGVDGGEVEDEVLVGGVVVDGGLEGGDGVFGLLVGHVDRRRAGGRRWLRWGGGRAPSAG